MAFEADQIRVPAVTPGGVPEHFFTLSRKMLAGEGTGEVQQVNRRHFPPHVGFVIHNYCTSLRYSNLPIKHADK